ncbi:hypothetical protein J437_LFUL002278 [Ladona fulva]|uniref:Ig-like domain-containing protein n=1 Tax=Ladona fulva TaxID=123851 RepID=A0A8K0JYY8_LADFU|nr:hypothetical protein J437_LFUL002278 [Ladona fulva]
MLQAIGIHRKMTGTLWKTVFALLVTIFKCSGKVSHEAPVIREVAEGDTAVLPCPSNDLPHKFIYWERTGPDNTYLVIGPGNDIDRTKYKYEVLSGTLYIRAITKEEGGAYMCVSQNLVNSSIYIRPVELVVKQDWEEVWETDYETNLLRGWIAFIVVGALLACAYAVFRYRRRSSTRFTAIPDDEAPEDSGAVELTSGNIHGNGEADTSVDTDFPRAFNAMYRPMGGVEARL